MYSPFWESVSRLERCGFKVMGLTCDGLSANRLLFKLHAPQKQDLVHSVINPYAHPKRPLFFFSDPPHLMKTVRNEQTNKKRKLQVYEKVTKLIIHHFPFQINGKKISWDHLSSIYEKDRGGGSSTSPGLALLYKIKYEHIHLTSYSKMRVDLAAQVQVAQK